MSPRDLSVAAIGAASAASGAGAALAAPATASGARPAVAAPLLLFYCQRVALDRKFAALTGACNDGVPEAA